MGVIGRVMGDGFGGSVKVNEQDRIYKGAPGRMGSRVRRIVSRLEFGISDARLTSFEVRLLCKLWPDWRWSTRGVRNSQGRRLLLH